MVDHQPSEESREANEPQAEWNPDSSGACADSRTPCVATADGDSANETSAPDIERFFCIYCGYDLTGHSGDTRRCPECGKTTTLDELKAALAMKSINAWEAPVVPSLLFLPTAFFGFPSVVILLQNSIDWFSAMFWLLFAVSAVAWCLALRTYFRRYGNLYDCLAFLGASHLVAVQIVLGGVVLGAMGLAMLLVVNPSGFDTTLLIIAIASAAFVASSYWPYRYMKRRTPAYKLPKPPGTSADE
ncbi:MAG: hypothetical protein O7D91_01080 [Planctomycetota bacterium]|nr:hypothetical protein [Planctomycetota bacterium]